MKFNYSKIIVKLLSILVISIVSGIIYSCSISDRENKDVRTNKINNTKKEFHAIIPDSGSNNETINIGLIISEQQSKSELSLAAIHGAELAIKQANLNSDSCSKVPFKLVVRSCDGPWGVGSREAVSMIYEDDARAILASLDGRNAHLVEQVSAKTRVAMLSTRASDPSLSQAFIPWFFRCIPNDDQQAKALVEEIIIKRKLSNIAAISDDSYDGKLTSKSFVKQAEIVGAAKPIQLFYDHLKPDFHSIISQIEKNKIQNIVLFGQPETSLQFIQEVNERKMDLSVFGSLSVLGENEYLQKALRNYTQSILVSSNHWFTEKGQKFQEQFYKTYGYYPGAVAAYAYDGANIIIESIQKAGIDRDEIIESISQIKYEGITGKIQFDDSGRRIGKVDLMEVVDSGKVLKCLSAEVLK